MRTFWLGAPDTSWVSKAGVPLVVSHRRLGKRKTLPVAIAPWVLDSGAFTELNVHGEWRTTAGEYVAAVRRYQNDTGMLAWAAPMDWMCEPFIVAKTGLSVAAHQARTVENYQVLQATGLPFVPVLQGWTLADYLRCVELYEKAGVELTTLPLVGIGSVCRRQHTVEVAEIVSTIAGLGIRLHGFGVKMSGLGSYANLLESADSMAWAVHARYGPPLPGCTHRNCTSCLDFALAWRKRMLEEVEGRAQTAANAARPTKDEAACCLAKRLPDGRPVIGWCGPDCLRRPSKVPPLL